MLEPCKCKWCGEPTVGVADECDSCHELASRVRANPSLARRVLAANRPSAFGLDPDTKVLVHDFAVALEQKLLVAQLKYGYTNQWKKSDWMDKCRSELAEHTAKGDPVDVACYCAFLWYHNEPTVAGKTDV